MNSTFLGISHLFKKILEVYHDPNDAKKFPQGRYINPYRVNNNTLELEFCIVRQGNNDLLSNYSKHHSQRVMKVDMQVSQPKAKAKNSNTVASHRARTRYSSRNTTS